MARKRKYAKFGEQAVRLECSNRNCKWQGTYEEQIYKQRSKSVKDAVCPKCGNNEFYGLLY